MIFISLAMLAGYSFICLCAGAAILRVVFGRDSLPGDHTPMARVATGFVLGVGILANVWLGISLIPRGWFTLPVVAAVAVVCLLCGGVIAGRQLAALWRQFASAVARNARDNWAWKLLGLCGLIFPVLYALTAALPPKGDGAAFYMVLPKVLAHTHVLFPLPGYELFTQIGLVGEMHFAALMSFGGEQAAWMFPFLMSVATAMMLLELGRAAGLGRRGRWILLIMLYTSTAFVLWISGGKVEMFGISMAMGAIYLALHADGPARSRVVALAGLLVGFACVAKLSLLGTVVPMVGILVLWRTAQSSSRRTWPMAFATCCVWLILAAAAGVGMHMVKNAVLFDNPLVPFVGANNWLKQELLKPHAVRDLLRIAPVAPYLGLLPGMGGSVSTLVLAFFPLVFWLPRPGRKKFFGSTMVQLTLVGAFGVALWMTLQTPNFSPRYFLPPLLLLMLAPARAAEYMCDSPTAKGWLKTGIVVCLFLAAAERFNRPRGHVGRAFGFVTARRSLEDVGGHPARLMTPINRLARPDARVLACTHYRYYLRPDLLVAAVGEDDWRRLAGIKNPEQCWRTAADMGFEYIVVTPAYGRISDDAKGFHVACGGAVLDTAHLPAELKIVPLYVERVDMKQKNGVCRASYRLRRRDGN
jgi:hypothetical protein